MGKSALEWNLMNMACPLQLQTHNICSYLHRTYTILDLLTKLPGMRRELRLPYLYLIDESLFNG